MDHRHLLRLEQVQGEVLLGADLLACRGPFALYARAVDEGVEAAAGWGAGKARDVIDELHRQVAARTIDGHALAYEGLVAGECGGGRGLADRRRAGGDLRLQGVDGRDQFGGTDSVADAPAGHGVRLGDAVGEEHPLGQAGFDG